jgi:hypothetical protein
MFNVGIYRARKGVPGVGRKLAIALDAYEVTSVRPAERPAPGAVVINYGRREKPAWYDEFTKNGGRIVNRGSAVAKCVDKRRTLAILREGNVPCLEFTEAQGVAQSWADKGNRVFVRETAKGKKGRGITIVGPGGDVPPAPLYTLDYPKTHEFRVHVAFGKVIDFVQKKKMGAEKRKAMGIDAVNEDVRNHHRGWVFAHNDLIVSEKEWRQLANIAIEAANVLGLDYCGIDMLADHRNGVLLSAVICEVNSAPGMSSKTTFDAYVGAFKEFIAKDNAYKAAAQD